MLLRASKGMWVRWRVEGEGLRALVLLRASKGMWVRCRQGPYDEMTTLLCMHGCLPDEMATLLCLHGCLHVCLPVCLHGCLHGCTGVCVCQVLCPEGQYDELATLLWGHHEDALVRILTQVSGDDVAYHVVIAVVVRHGSAEGGRRIDGYLSLVGQHLSVECVSSRVRETPPSSASATVLSA